MYYQTRTLFCIEVSPNFVCLLLVVAIKPGKILKFTFFSKQNDNIKMPSTEKHTKKRKHSLLKKRIYLWVSPLQYKV